MLNSSVSPTAAPALAPAWWERPDLCTRGAALVFDGCDMEQISRAEPKPVFISPRHACTPIRRGSPALGASGLRGACSTG